MPFGSHSFFPVPCRRTVLALVLLAGPTGTSGPAHAVPTHTATRADLVQPPAHGVSGLPLEPRQETTESEEHVEVEGHPGVEIFVEFFILGPLLLLFLALLLAIPTTVLGVSLVMDGGCLKYLLFGLGWLFAVFYGLLFGGIVGEMVLGWEALVGPLVHVFIWGYPAAAWWAHNKLQSMPPEQYKAWDQSLTGGALLGFGAASAASLLRSVFALKGGGFGGFGGGSFGGGGASGSWSGAASAAAGAAPASASSSSAGVSGAASAASAGVVPAATSADDPRPSSQAASNARGFRARLRAWADKFEWYHGLAFVLGTLVFVPLGLGAVHALQNTEVFVFVLVCIGIYTLYRVAQRASDAPDRTEGVSSSGPGGRASATWA